MKNVIEIYKTNAFYYLSVEKYLKYKPLLHAKMDVKGILHTLENQFGLSKKHTKILKILIGKELTAKQICEKTGLSLGTLYPFLNELCDSGLINVNDAYPTVYSITDFMDNVAEFSVNKMKELREKRNSLMKQFEPRDKIEVIPIVNSEEYNDHLASLWLGTGHCQVIARDISIPYEFYTSNPELFRELRELAKNNRPVLSDTNDGNISYILFKIIQKAHQKKRPFTYIVSRGALDFYFGILRKTYEPKRFKEIMAKIKSDIFGMENLNIVVVEEGSKSVVVLDGDEGLVVNSRDGNQYVPSGFKFTSQHLVKSYKALFDSYMQKGVTLKEYFEGRKW